MNRIDEVSPRIRDHAETSTRPELAHSLRHSFAGETDPDRIAALEQENSRLHRLVAELLIKNQQLRKAE
jgi:hypothetical protein